MKNILWMIPVMTMVIFGCLMSREQEINFKSLIPDEAKKALKNDSTIIILDVRTEEEYHSETGYLNNSRLIPVQDLDTRINELDTLKGKQFLIYCRSGRRSAHACTFLASKGFKVWNMEGGIIRWKNEGFPVVQADK
jgi:rhodanese-related sulfurtransferase